jgi:hypothetical protein
LGYKLPALFIDTHYSTENKKATVYSFVNTIKLNLEGDFNNYFQIFCIDGTQQEILETFTPDFMALLVDTINKFDIEITDGKLILIYDKKINNNDIIKDELLEISKKITTELNKKHFKRPIKDTQYKEIIARPYGTIRILGRYIPKNLLLVNIFCLAIFLPSLAGMIYAFNINGRISWVPIIFALIIYPTIPIIMYWQHKNEFLSDFIERFSGKQ